LSFELTFFKELKGDNLVKHHIGELYESLLEQHLLKIVEPFSRVEVSHLAKLLKISKNKVEIKLSQMILDNRLSGIIDQGHDCLILYEENKIDKSYPYAIETLNNFNLVVDSIFERAQELKK
jgi:26S proteasome regulatory subunit N6